MSQTEDQNDQPQEPEASNAAPDASEDEIIIVEGMKPSAAVQSNNKPLRYGNRKNRPGASAPAIAPISSYSAELDEEEIEMDDLPVKANAPEHLIDSRTSPSETRSRDDSDRPRRENRPRGERRRRQDRERDPENEIPTKQSEESDTEDSSQGADRPERFGVVETKERRERAEKQIQEFRPSRDGRTMDKSSKRVDRSSQNRKPIPMPKKKGIIAKIIAFFTGNKEEERKSDNRRRTDGPRPRGNRGRRGPNYRQRDGEENREGGNQNRRRPRNRKPRQEGDRSNRPEGSEGGPRRRRRRPRGQEQGRGPRGQENA